MSFNIFESPTVSKQALLPAPSQTKVFLTDRVQKPPPDSVIRSEANMARKIIFATTEFEQTHCKPDQDHQNKAIEVTKQQCRWQEKPYHSSS